MGCGASSQSAGMDLEPEDLEPQPSMTAFTHGSITAPAKPIRRHASLGAPTQAAGSMAVIAAQSRMLASTTQKASSLPNSYGIPVLDKLLQDGHMLSPQQAAKAMQEDTEFGASKQLWECGISFEFLTALQAALAATSQSRPGSVPDVEGSDDQDAESQTDGHSISTAEFVNSVVLPATKQLQCRFCDLLPAKHVKRPDYFISFMFDEPFSTTYDLMDTYMQKRRLMTKEANGNQSGRSTPQTIHVWFAPLAINQHKVMGEDGDLKQLHTAVQHVEATLLCLDGKGVTLSRIWCLYEIWHTVQAKTSSGLKVLTGQLDLAALRNVFETLDVREAQATLEEDRNRILTDIENSVGAVKLGQDIRKALIASVEADGAYVMQTAESLNRMDPDLEQKMLDLSTESDKYGGLLRTAGAFAAAEPLHRLTVELRQKVLGNDHPGTAAATNNLAQLLGDQGKHREAELMYRQALHIAIRTLGPDHPNTAAVCNNLAGMLRSQGKFTDAEPLYRQALDTAIKTTGPSMLTASAMNNLALLLEEEGKLQEAEAMYMEALKTLQQNLGPKHPVVATNLANISALQQKRGDLSAAEATCRQALVIREETLGDGHPETLTSCNNLAEIMRDQGKVDEAEKMHREVLRVRIAIIGTDHPDTAASMLNLADLLKSKGKLDEALTFAKQAMDVRQRILGDSSQDTIISMNQVAMILFAMHKKKEAEAMFKSAMLHAAKALGVNHPMTRSIQDNMHSCR